MNRIEILACLAFVCMVTLSAPAAGQSVRPRGVSTSGYTIAIENSIHAVPLSQQDMQENTMRDLARCALRYERSDVDRTLAMKTDTQEYVRSLTELASSKCLRTGHYSLQPAAFRAALFRELYLLEFKHRAIAALQSSVGYADDIRDPNTDSATMYLVSHKLADCVVVKDPADSRRLVLMEAGDSREDKTFASLTNPLQDCLPAGQTVALDRYQVSGWIAEALYRESKHALVTNAAGEKL